MTDPALETLLAGRFRPEQTALLIIDVQNDFCARGGFFDQMGHPLDMAEAAVDRLERFIPRARAAGITPIFVRAIYDEPYVSDVRRDFYASVGYPPESCISDQWGSEFFQLQPEPDDLIVIKHRFSAFINTDLPLLLRSREIKSLILTGVATNVCVESTARDGFMLDYHVMLLSDCCGTYDQGLHDGTMENIRRSFGVVATSGDLAAALDAVVAQPAA